MKGKGKRKNDEPILLLLPFTFFLALLLFNEFGPMVTGDEPRQQRNRDEKNQRNKNPKSVRPGECGARNHPRNDGQTLGGVRDSSQKYVECAGCNVQKRADGLKD